MSKSVIVLVLLAAGLALLALLLPPLLVRNAVRSSASSIAEAVRQEDMATLESHILPAERSLARSLIEPLLPGHGQNLDRFRVLSMDRLDDRSYRVSALFNFEDPSWGRQIIEARLLMRRDSSEWFLSLTETDARQFTLADNTDWTKATDWLNLARP